MPPAALTSSAAMMMPLCVEVPKVACEPVREPYSPMRISPVDAAVPVDALPVAVPVSPFGGQPASDSDSDATSAMKPNFRMSPPPKSARILQQSPVHKAFRYCCKFDLPRPHRRFLLGRRAPDRERAVLRIDRGVELLLPLGRIARLIDGDEPDEALDLAVAKIAALDRALSVFGVRAGDRGGARRQDDGVIHR